MTNVEIRIAEASDLDGINAVNREIREDPDSFHPPTDFDVDSIVKVEDRIFFVAPREGEIIGYLRLHASKSLTQIGDGEFEIYVKPTWQRKGIGKQLLVKAEQYAIQSTKLSRLTLKVLAKNKRAISLYERRGFKVVAKIRSVKEGVGFEMAKDIER